MTGGKGISTAHSPIFGDDNFLAVSVRMALGAPMPNHGMFQRPAAVKITQSHTCNMFTTIDAQVSLFLPMMPHPPAAIATYKL